MELKNNIISDIDLIERYKETLNPNLIGELYKRYSSFCYGVSMKYMKNDDDSRDVVMSVFEKLFDLLLKHQVENFKPWLYSVVKNHCFSQLKKSKNTSQLDDENFSNNFMENGAFNYQENNVDSELVLQKLENLIPQLAEEQKKCIELFYIKEKSYQEVSIETGYDLKKVKSYIQNGKRNLKIMLEKNEK